jgi:hypothetical protein
MPSRRHPARLKRGMDNGDRDDVFVDRTADDRNGRQSWNEERGRLVQRQREEKRDGETLTIFSFLLEDLTTPPRRAR